MYTVHILLFLLIHVALPPKWCQLTHRGDKPQRFASAGLFEVAWPRPERKQMQESLTACLLLNLISDDCNCFSFQTSEVKEVTHIAFFAVELGVPDMSSVPPYD